MKLNITKLTMQMITAVLFFVIGASQAFASPTWLFSITKTSVPTRIALDGKGNIYVTEPRNKNRVLVFDRQGNHMRTLAGLKGPIGIAVDNNSKIYVGNSVTGSVDVYNPNFTFAFKLGSGDGEVKLPNSIVVTSAGRIYVVDSKDNLVKVYNQDGKSAFSFGGYGGANGKFIRPLGIALDEAAGELYVTDCGLFTSPDGVMGGARVQVFDLNGAFKRSFGQYGSGVGQMKMPIGIAADGAGMLYITDANLGSFHVFTTSGSWVETIFDTAHLLKIPIGIAVGKDRRLFVASSNGPSIEVYGLPGHTTMDVAPKTLNFAAGEGDTDPATQSITISNTGSGSLGWTATASTTDGNPWLVVTPGSGTTAPSGTSTISMGANSKALGLRAGSYSGTVTVTADSGAEEKIAVNLSVTAPPAILSVVPSQLAFKGQQNGPAPQPQSFSINNIGSGNMTWSASTDAKWLTLGVSSSFLSVSPNTSGLSAGTYNSAVTVTAPGAQGSPAVVSVSLRIVTAGTLKLTSNIEKAAFDITGSASYSGTGKTWSSDEVTPGDYSITFKPVAGYLKPVAKKITIKSGQEVAVSGDYRKKAVATHILAGSADTANKEMTLFVLPLEGDKMPVSFAPFKNPDSVRVAAGDLEGTGNDNIVVTDYKRSIKVYPKDNGDPASYSLPEGYSHADAAVGDIDNDGKAEIIVAAENQSQPRRVVKVFSYVENSLQERSTLFTEDKEGRFSIALGDVNDDGALELLIADANSVRALSQGPGGLTQLWSRSGDYGNMTQIAAGDLNGDGISEIAVSYEQMKETKGRGRTKEEVIVILKGTGEDSNVIIEPFKDLGYTKPATVSIGDIDGDLADEVVVGAGPAESNDPIIRIFESDGSYAGVTMKPMNGKFGVNVGQGSFR